MEKVVLLAALTAGMALAQAATFTLKPATVVAAEVKRENDRTFAQAFNYFDVIEAYPHVRAKKVTQPPGNKLLTDLCVNHTRSVLNIPGKPTFSQLSQPVYNVDGGVYFMRGSVASRTSSGIRLQRSFWCTMVFQGADDGGTVYVISDMVR
ncbi:hypothetical protein DEDE109153_16430 [Deinococcus deserti]|uniref:Uncharacterized protein n=1 Tax=Deinococcus deserti (strain DSM 17065 / CIP 109153 / LMG 22923 / VCD115) TaxID=546414 RepID=C1D2A3_DEIDV|nr:hypothetical protein [Deinococcus deserti]ACO47542.1 Hypothetical protein, precursor [Deinococcus deserti VCD115]